jgi:hypothetical protein
VLKKIFLIAIIVILATIGSVSAYTTIKIVDPFYYLPAIPIMIASFLLAGILLFSLLKPRHNERAFRLLVYAFSLFIFTGSAVVTGDYIHRQTSQTLDSRIISYCEIENMTYLDRERVDFSLSVYCVNETFSEISLAKVEFNIYYDSPDWKTKHLALHDQWNIAQTITTANPHGFERGFNTATIVTINNSEILSMINEDMKIGKIKITFDGSIWFNTQYGLRKQDVGSSKEFPK